MPKSFRPSEGNISQISQRGRALVDTVSESSLDFDIATQAELDAHKDAGIALAHPNGSLPHLRVDGLTGFVDGKIADHAATDIAVAHPSGFLPYGRVDGLTGFVDDKITDHSNVDIADAHPNGLFPYSRLTGVDVALVTVDTDQTITGHKTFATGPAIEGRMEFLPGHELAGTVAFSGSLMVSGGVVAQSNVWIGQDLLVEGDVFVDQGIHEQSQVTIGDGVTTFGTYNATILGGFPQALTVALAALPAGGTLYLKRGSYRLFEPVTIGDNIRIRGEGPTTVISVTGPAIKLQVEGKDASLRDMRLHGLNAATLLSLTGAAQNVAVIGMVFTQAGATCTDIVFSPTGGHRIEGNRSETVVTNMP